MRMVASKLVYRCHGSFQRFGQGVTSTTRYAGEAWDSPEIQASTCLD